MSNKKVIRIGDKIQINIPRHVVRVGYPKSVYDYEKDVNHPALCLAEELMSNPDNYQNILKLISKEENSWTMHLQKCSYETLNLSSYLQAKTDGFGGKERTIHFEDLNSLYWRNYEEDKFEPFVTTVVGKRRVVTGTYYPPSRICDRYDGPVPGGLDNQKHHILYATAYGEFHQDDVEYVKDSTGKKVW